MFTVYVLKSATSGKMYIGQTNNLAKRLGQHNSSHFDKKSYTELAGINGWLCIKKDMVRDKKLLNESAI